MSRVSPDMQLVLDHIQVSAHMKLLERLELQQNLQVELDKQYLQH
jgi:hypothetical protein